MKGLLKKESRIAFAGVNTHGMYHPDVMKPMMVKKVLKKKASNISPDGMALVPTPGLARKAADKKFDDAENKRLDKKLKGYKFGVGVGP